MSHKWGVRIFDNGGVELVGPTDELADDATIFDSKDEASTHISESDKVKRV